MNQSGFADYLVLRNDDAVISDSPHNADFSGYSVIYEWNLDDSYYSNARGSVTSVSLVDCFFYDISSADERKGLIFHNLPKYNLTDTTNEEFAVVGKLGEDLVFDKTNPIIVYTKARPRNIKIKVFYFGGVNQMNAQATKAIFTLKFCYYNDKETQMDFMKGNTNFIY